jgi:hypothetical protein
MLSVRPSGSCPGRGRFRSTVHDPFQFNNTIMKKKVKTNYDADRLHRIRKQQAFDFLRVNQGDLTPDQMETFRMLFNRNKGRGLTDQEMQMLFDLVDSLKPDNELLIHQNF